MALLAGLGWGLLPHMTPNPLEGTSSSWQAVFVFVVEGLGAGSRLMQEQAALKGMNGGADCFSEDGLVALSA